MYQLDRFELSQSDGSMRAWTALRPKIDNLREGRYLLEARGTAARKQYTGFKQVDVSDGDTRVFIQLEEAGVINGRIIAERGGNPPLDNGGISAWWLLDDVVVGAVRVAEQAIGGEYIAHYLGTPIPCCRSTSPTGRRR
jgi:hypothetical protein